MDNESPNRGIQGVRLDDGPGNGSSDSVTREILIRVMCDVYGNLGEIHLIEMLIQGEFEAQQYFF